MVRSARSRAIVCRPILATQNLLQGLCGEIHSCEALHLKWLPAKRQLRIKFNYATYNDQKESCRQMGASTPANSYYSILVQNNEAGCLINGPYRHWPPSPPLPLLPVVWSKEAVQGLHLCQRNQATSSEKTPQNPTTSHSTANILTYAFLNVDNMARISTSSITKTLCSPCIWQLWPATPLPIEGCRGIPY